MTKKELTKRYRRGEMTPEEYIREVIKLDAEIREQNEADEKVLSQYDMYEERAREEYVRNVDKCSLDSLEAMTGDDTSLWPT